jgi:hypothetical protein
MSLVKVSGNASGTGTLTIAAPNTNTDYTLTLPTNTGTLLSTKSAGTVLQVVNATYSTQLSTTSTSYVDTGLSASITPTSATSKILIFVEQTGVGKNAGDSSQRVALNILRNSTQIVQFELGAGYTGSSVVNVFGGSGSTYLDSPATTSSVTYKTQIKGFAGVNVYANYDNCTSTITLMEIAA